MFGEAGAAEHSGYSKSETNCSGFGNLPNLGFSWKHPQLSAGICQVEWKGSSLGASCFPRCYGTSSAGSGLRAKKNKENISAPKATTLAQSW